MVNSPRTVLPGLWIDAALTVLKSIGIRNGSGTVGRRSSTFSRDGPCIQVYRIVGVATAAGAEALLMPPGA